MLPSINTKVGFFFNFLIALLIANKLAFRILYFSISLIDAVPIDHLELFLIYMSKFSLLILVNFFESVNFFISILLLSITAAAYTGPIKLPLPTSSTPAIIFFIII